MKTGNNGKFRGSKPGIVRTRNRQAILSLYRSEETLSASAIASRTRLSRTTAMKINYELLQEGYITSAGKGSSTDEGGKKPDLYRFNATRQQIITFHVKYESVEFRLCDLLYNELIHDSEPFLSDSEPRVIAEKMKAVLQRNSIVGDSRLYLACVVALHANVDAETGRCLHSTHFPSWTPGTDILSLFQKATGLDCPFYLDNWIRLKTFGESRLGPAVGHESAILLNAGWHGVSSGIIMEGRLYQGKHGLSGEIGHISLEPDSPALCACGSRGCLESLTDCGKLIHRAAPLIDDIPEDLLTLPLIFERADGGNEAVRTLLADYIKWFALALSNIIMLLDPEIIIMEGDYASGCHFLEDGIRKMVKSITLPRLNRETPFLVSNTSEVDTLKSAAVFAMEHYFI